MNDTRILILEDEAIVADDIRHCLEQAGYVVTAICSTGEQLISLLEKEQADLVLVDIMLAGKIDGIDTARIIRERHKIPVVYLTSFTNQTMLERARETFPTGYIVKPFKKRELLATVEIAIYPNQSTHNPLHDVQPGIGQMIAGSWLSYLKQNLVIPPSPRMDDETLSSEYSSKPKTENLVLLWEKIIGPSQTSTPDLSNILNLVRELTSILQPNLNLSIETSGTNPRLAIDPILLIDALLYILYRNHEFSINFEIKTESLPTREHTGNQAGDPDMPKQQIILKIMTPSGQALRHTTPSFSIKSDRAWPIYQNAFASQGSQIRLRDPEDSQELIAEMLLNTH